MPEFLRNAILKDLIVSSHDISDGGLAIALAECCILSDRGAKIKLDEDFSREDSLLFAEGGSRIIFSINHTKEKEWLNYLKETQINTQPGVYVKKIDMFLVEILTLKSKIRISAILELRN